VRAYSLQVGVAAVAKPVTEAKPPQPKRHSMLALTVAGIVVLILIAGGAWYFLVGSRTAPVVAKTPAPAEAPHLSIVVLPFANLSADPEQDYFADGLTDDLTTDLSHLAGSFVIARNTAFTYKGKAVDARQIGRELGVLYVLEGSVRRVGEKVTVNIQLISTDTGAHVWADRFDGERSKLGQLQMDFVARLARSLDVELVRAEALRATRERPNNPDAVDLSMRGWMERYRGLTSRTNEVAAVALFERALAVDPHLVPAMVGLAQTLASRVTYLHSDDPKSDNARAKDWAERAVAAEPYNSAAHVAKAQVFYNKRQWPRVMAEADAAVADNPNNAAAHA
jgi:adenylate cyclase